MFAAKAVAVLLVSAAAVNAAPGLIDDLTSDVASVFGKATSAVESVLVLETASSVFKDATKVLGTSTSQAYATIVTANGVPVVEVTSVGGPAITLATGTATGFTTSFVGHTFTAAPTTTSSSSSAASASATGKDKNAGSSLDGRAALQLAAFVGSVVAGAALVF